AGTDAEAARRLERRFAQAGMGRQAQVVVRRQVHHLPVIERGLRPLLAFEDAEMTVEALLLQGVEFGLEKRKRVAAHAAQFSSPETTPSTGRWPPPRRGR